MLATKIAPKIVRVLDIPEIVRGRLLAQQPNHAAQPRSLKSLISPIEIVTVLPMIAKEGRIRTELCLEEIQRLHGAVTPAGLHGRSMKSNLEPVDSKLTDKFKIGFSL